MPCPYFGPTQPLPCSAWQSALRPPLGEPYRGQCHAQAEPFDPSESRLVDCCNLGYVQGECERFPEGPGPDAVRFSLSGDDGKLISIAYALEKNHLPHRNGTLKYNRGTESWQGPGDDAVFAAQAAAFLQSYLRWCEKQSSSTQRGRAQRAAAGNP